MDYIVLDGNNATWDGSADAEWQIPSYYFKNLKKDQQIKLTLERSIFTDTDLISDPIIKCCEVVTDLVLKNQSNTNSRNTLDIYDLDCDTTNNIISPINHSGMKPTYLVDKFDSIKIGVLHEDEFLNLNSVLVNTRFILKLEHF